MTNNINKIDASNSFDPQPSNVDNRTESTVLATSKLAKQAIKPTPPSCRKISESFLTNTQKQQLATLFNKPNSELGLKALLDEFSKLNCLVESIDFLQDVTDIYWNYIELLLKHPCSQKIDLNASINSSKPGSLLHFICSNTLPLDLLLLTLDKGANPNIKDSYGDTPLYYCISNGLFDYAEALLNRKADPNSQNLLGNTPLHTFFFIPENEMEKWADLFIKHRADPDLKNNDQQSSNYIIYFNYRKKITPLNLTDKIAVKVKKIATTWGLTGNYGALKINGLPARGMSHSFHKSLNTYAAKHLSLQPNEKKLLEMIDLEMTRSIPYHPYATNLPAKEALDRIKSGQLTFVFTGWERHALQVAFCGNILAILNPGQREDEFEGIEIYEFNPDLLNEEQIEALMYFVDNKVSFPEVSAFTYHLFLNEIGANKTSSTMKLQKNQLPQRGVNNCTYACREAAILFSYCLLGKKYGIDDPVLRAENVLFYAKAQRIKECYNKMSIEEKKQIRPSEEPEDYQNLGEMIYDGASLILDNFDRADLDGDMDALYLEVKKIREENIYITKDEEKLFERAFKTGNMAEFDKLIKLLNYEGRFIKSLKPFYAQKPTSEQMMMYKKLFQQPCAEQIDVNESLDYHYTFLLHIVCQKDEGQFLIPLLLEKGADLNSQDIDGNTALHYIYQNQHLFHLAPALTKEYGGNDQIRNKKGLRPSDCGKKNPIISLFQQLTSK